MYTTRNLNKSEKAILNKLPTAIRRHAFAEQKGNAAGAIPRYICKWCEFVVDLGHKCTFDTAQPKIENNVVKVDDSRNEREADAWIGDSLLSLDMRVGLTLSTNKIDNVSYQKYVSNAYMKNYMMGKGTRMPYGASDHSYGTAFESQYRGKFRQEYMEHVFGADQAELIIKKTTQLAKG